MRRPSRFSLYWTKKDGLDYVLYSKLEAEADYFMLEGLKNWIKDRKYLEAVTIKQRVIDRYDLGIHRSGDCEIKHFIIKGALEASCPSGLHPSWGQDCWRNDCDNRKGPKQQHHIQAKDVFLTVTTEFVLVNDILQNEGTASPGMSRSSSPGICFFCRVVVGLYIWQLSLHLFSSYVYPGVYKGAICFRFVCPTVVVH